MKHELEPKIKFGEIKTKGFWLGGDKVRKSVCSYFYAWYHNQLSFLRFSLTEEPIRSHGCSHCTQFASPCSASQCKWQQIFCCAAIFSSRAIHVCTHSMHIIHDRSSNQDVRGMISLAHFHVNYSLYKVIHIRRIAGGGSCTHKQSVPSL